MTTKSTTCFLFLFFVIVFFCTSIHIGTSNSFEQRGEDKSRRILIQREGKEEKGNEADPHYIQVLKSIQEKLDDWLKSLNERIEKEDVTRLEVRFLEILRNILEWVKERVDAQIQSAEKQKQKPREKRPGSFRETRQRVRLLSGVG